MDHTVVPHRLLENLDALNIEEKQRLSAYATFSSDGKRRNPEPHIPYRQEFAIDADRILHSRAYSRYIDKTQVFSLVRNDHITHRIIHVQLVARIARTIGRFLHLNEDLIEAISLGHDIGHPPFGHDGEKHLSALCTKHGLAPFQHNIQSVRFLDRLEKKGTGWNLTLQVLDGILCHDGEVHSNHLSPLPISSFDELEERIHKKSAAPDFHLHPSTLEGCVVRFSDTIAYIGRDIEDAIVLGLITREDLPESCVSLLGNTNGTIVHSLVTDLIHASLQKMDSEPVICFSKEIADALQELKTFNYEKIYFAPQSKQHTSTIKKCYKDLFTYYLERLEKNPDSLPPHTDLMTDISPLSVPGYSAPERVRDFIAGMTDNYFLGQAREIGCDIPEMQPYGLKKK